MLVLSSSNFTQGFANFVELRNPNLLRAGRRDCHIVIPLSHHIVSLYSRHRHRMHQTAISFTPRFHRRGLGEKKGNVEESRLSRDPRAAPIDIAAKMAPSCHFGGFCQSRKSGAAVQRQRCRAHIDYSPWLSSGDCGIAGATASGRMTRGRGGARGEGGAGARGRPERPVAECSRSSRSF